MTRSHAVNDEAASPSGSISTLIGRVGAGDADALDRLFTALYPELHALARTRVRRGASLTLLDTTSLLHETYLRLVKLEALDVESRAHFLTYASRTMRSIIVDFARQHLAQRRGSGIRAVELDTDAAPASSDGADEVIRVHEALLELASIDSRLVHVVELRFFGGLTESEIAVALGVSDRTVRRDWEKARMLLALALR